MRETDAHADFLYHFARYVMLNTKFDTECGKMKLSQMIGPSLEAFAVASYLNHHDSWSDEIRRKMEREASDDGVSNISSDNRSSGTETSKKLYTNNPREPQGKHRGWSERGKMIYNKIMKIIKEQRADVSNDQLRTFDDKLRTRWIRAGPKKRKRRADVDVLEIDDDLDELINERIGV